MSTPTDVEDDTIIYDSSDPSVWPEFAPPKVDVKISVEKLDVAYIKCPHCGKPIAVTVTLNTEGIEENKK